MDNFPADEIPPTEMEAVNQRKLPYIYTKELTDVKDYETDIFGALTSITFYYGKTSLHDQEDQVNVFVTYTRDDITKFAEYTDTEGKLTTREIDVYRHNLGLVPVAFWNREDITPIPPFLNMAQMARKIYNVESEINQLERTQNFSLLLIPSINAGSEPDSHIIVSTDNALFYDAESGSAPSFISPDSSLMNSALEYHSQCVNTLLQSADVLGSTAVQRGSKAESGNALAFKFFGKQQALKNSARKAEWFERTLVSMFGEFVGIDITYDVVYNDRFTPTYDEVVMRLGSMRDVISMNINDELNKQLFKDTVSLLAIQNNWSDEVLNNMIATIDSGDYNQNYPDQRRERVKQVMEDEQYEGGEKQDPKR
jgi:hypothetical protein